jgi:hypothetical protein
MHSGILRAAHAPLGYVCSECNLVYAIRGMVRDFIFAVLWTAASNFHYCASLRTAGRAARTLFSGPAAKQCGCPKPPALTPGIWPPCGVMS